MTDWASETEQRVLDAAMTLAPQMGWTSQLVERAGRRAGLTLGEVELLLPHGPRDLAALLSHRHDAAAFASLADTDPTTLKIRERIRTGVQARLDAAFADEEALRRWAGFLAFPTNLPLAMRLLWETADAIWRWAGDTATDENHYSKRAILSGILISTLGVRLTQGREAQEKELAARIENVMAFEKWKAGIKPGKSLVDIAAALGRLRYR
jgi:ubiquinone biosynthesis protein COQ9